MEVCCVHYFLFPQLCVAVCHLLVSASTGGRIKAGLLSQDLQESSKTHFSHFLSQSLLLDLSSPDKEERLRLVERARDELEQLGELVAAGLCDIFRECFQKRDKAQ